MSVATERKRTVPVMTYHDDWMVNVLLACGEVFSFNTEMWPEHGDGNSCWPPVIRRARHEAEMLSARNAEPYCLVEIFDGFGETDLHDAVNDACEVLSDADFRRLIRR